MNPLASTSAAAFPRIPAIHPHRPDRPVADLSQEQIKRRPVLGGLINEYERAAYMPRSGPIAEFRNPTGQPRRYPEHQALIAGAAELTWYPPSPVPWSSPKTRTA